MKGNKNEGKKTNVCKTIFSWLEKHFLPFVICFIIAFIAVGIYLNLFWKFSYFYIYFAIFLTIGIGSYFAERKFIKLMNDTLADVISQPPFLIPRIRYLKSVRHPINKIVPIGVVLFFGIGGCSLYSKLSITPTFIWCLALFCPVVIISIRAYLKYIYLAIFLFSVSISKESYKNLPIITSTELPLEINWRRRLYRLLSIYQGAFFGLGSLYITAFAIFCFVPEFGVVVYAPIFYILWAVIFLAIVLAFPIVGILEVRWYKKIEQHLKNSYLDLWKKNKLPFEKKNPLSELLGELIRNQCLAFIFPSEKRGISNALKISYTCIAATFNFVISLITILQFFQISSISF